MTEHHMRVAQNGTFYCVDELGMMCAGNWPYMEGWERHVSGADEIVIVKVADLKAKDDRIAELEEALAEKDRELSYWANR
ncbi:hypothetical protein PBI_WHIRLWIND_121 [Mycobacterium phage Whirlwind]|uniref:Uncharacterized protein n=1 Tax=Mycobacterium phage Whirlwind TaxID=1340826 RepID=S5Y518_9CAUD|nr:hypothetical protein N852_gp068 [Mycobacterium phage Whirlwind]AGT12717.1 hypothetical protein PBI_WHIRLWIND_121 [Mycobacterium phage Whirlwind]